MGNRLSIIIPVYNVEKYLRKCLDSIFVDNQFTEQVVCVNDGSTDGSLVILEQYATKYSNIEIITQSNKGLSEARNTGLRAAGGDYVMFLDSDDWLKPNALFKLSEQIHGEDVIYFNGLKYYEATNKYDPGCPIPAIKHMNGRAFFEKISNIKRNIPWVCVCGGVYNRRFLIDNNLWNEPGIYHEDSYFSPQVFIMAKNVSTTDTDVYVYRIRGGSITADVKPKNIKDALYVNRCLYDYYKSKSIKEKAFYRYVMELYIGIIVDAFSNHIHIHKMWSKQDDYIIKRCYYDERSRKIYKLSKVSLFIAYLYCCNKLPTLMRRGINRFL